MKIKIFSIKDKVVGAYRSPFYMRNNAEAIRAFNNSCKEVPDMAKVASDLELYCLGDFDDETGVITNQIEHLQSGFNGEYITKTINKEEE